MLIPHYKPVPTVARLMQDPSPLRSIIGPFGSGKSVGMIMETVRRAYLVPPSVVDGVRRSRVLFARNTFRELRDTTLKTALELFPDKVFGTFHKTNFVYDMRMRHPDGGLIELQILFRAFDSEESTKSVRSLELTGFWGNEASELSRKVLTRLVGRINRFPAKAHLPPGTPMLGYGLLDSNPPLVDSWLYCIHEGKDPDDPMKPMQSRWSTYNQPSALGPHGENLENQQPGYYQLMIDAGATEEEINTNIHGMYAVESLGQPMHKSFRREYHVAQVPITPLKNSAFPIVVGSDCGGTPAAVFTQSSPSGRVSVLDEVVATAGGGYERFLAEKIRPKIAERFAGFPIVVFIDPAGNNRSDVDGRTILDILHKAGFEAHRARGHNRIQGRLRAVDVLLTGQVNGGEPMLLVDPRCKTLIHGLWRGYRYHEVKVDKIDKDSADGRKYSHVCEALQYAALHVSTGRGSHGFWSAGSGRAKPVITPAEAWY